MFAIYVGGPASMLYVIFLMFGFMLILGVRLVVRETRVVTAGKDVRPCSPAVALNA